MRKSAKKVLYIIAFFLILLTIFASVKRLALWIEGTRASKYMDYPTLLPKIQQTMAVRFDPSFHYKGERPKKLAIRLAERWENAGINLVYYRAYDPKFGAFYRTRYKHNQEGEFGKYNLLKHIIKECHARNIRVFGWLPVMNHRGAWQAHPEWHERGVGGEDFTDIGLEFPLCARITEARTWWYNFVGDLLNNYPEIDGIDFAEPVVSWRKGDACFCEICTEALEKYAGELTPNDIRAQPLTALLKESIAITHRAGKRASITFVVVAASSGEIFSFKQIRNLTGFDLSSLLNAEDNEIPDIICPEFLWQEWKSRYGMTGALSQSFSPEWTEQAFRRFLRWIDIPVEVVIHLEITDFPGVEVDVFAFEASLQSALQGGAFGIDVYSSSQLDEKNAWPVLTNFKYLTKRKQCLVLYDPESNRNDAIQTGELLRHFNTEVTLQSLNAYSPGEIHEYDNVFYVGTELGTPIPASLIDDLLHLETTFCWLGFNIRVPLINESLSKKLGLKYLFTANDQYRSVSYKNITLRKDDPWTNVVGVSDNKRCKILATASDGKERVPYALRSGRRFWFFADVPSAYALEGGRFLVFADLLHDILNEDHAERYLAMVRIEDVHPLTDFDVLKKIADYLYSQGVPFQVAFVPIYVFPEVNVYVTMSEKPEFISALKYIIKKDGTLVMHGITHQRYGETTTDYEFWDPVSDSPIEGQTESKIRQRIERGLRECWSNGIYPLIWETPHYAGSQEFYSVISDFFSISMERRQAIDKTDTDQCLPYPIFSDRFGQIILPENLGYVPLSNQKAEVITASAKNMKVVRDAVASFFFHPFVDISVLKDIVRTMKKEQYAFTNASGLPIQVKTSFGVMKNRSSTIRLSPKNLSGQENRLLFPGIVSSQKEVVADPEREFKRRIDLQIGELFAVHFINPYEETRQSRREKQLSEKPEVMRVLQSVSNYMGERCKVPVPLLVQDATAQGALGKEIRSFESIFKLAGIDLQKIDVTEFIEIPPEFNLVILPSASAGSLSASQIEIIVNEIKKGNISLITSGFTPIADELAIDKTSEQIEVHSIVDSSYPNVEIKWNNAAHASVFEPSEGAAYIYVEKETKKPLVIASSLGNGKYIFLGIPLDERSAVGSTRFPYFLTHVFRHFQFFPLVRSANAEVFFNPADREEAAIEDLVKFWRRSGVRIIHVAGWQIFPEWAFDYERLINLVHTNAMLAYVWLEPPYVHEKFWEEHPEWREKNALGEDAVVDWRKPMALGDPQALNAVLEEWRTLLGRFNWDGVTLNRLGFESEGGLQFPEAYTPFHPSVREKFKDESGFDPVELFDSASINYWKNNPVALREFKNFRGALAQSYAESLLTMISEIKTSEKNSWELILTHDARRSDSGIELATLRNLKQRYSAKLQLIPLTKEQWILPGEEFDLVQLYISPNLESSTFHPLAPTQYPTGIALYNQLQKFNDNSQRYTLFSENSLYETDTSILPLLLASRNTEFWSEEGLFVKTPHSGEIVFSDETLENLTIDDVPAGSFYRNRLVLPVGEHKIALANNGSNLTNGLKSEARLVDCSGDLLKSNVTSRGITVDYRTDKRAVLVINEKPRAVYLNNTRIKINPEKGLRGWSIILPSGQHSAKIITRGLLNLSLTWLSLAISNAIIAISTIGIFALFLIFALKNIRSRYHSKG